jgi:hypothetical protein
MTAQHVHMRRHDHLPPVLIVGSPRSGTTFLTRVGSRFLDAHIARDGGLFLQFYRMRSRFGDLGNDLNLKRLISAFYRDAKFKRRLRERGLSLDEAQLFESIQERTFAGVVRSVFRHTAQTYGKSQWGNKNPSYALMAFEELEGMFPGAVLIHIIRDARDVALSMRRAATILVEKNWYFAARDWRDHVAGGRALGRRLGPERYLEVTYEQLLTDPVSTFSRILALTGAADPAANLERVRTEMPSLVKPGNTDKWRREMPREGIRVVEKVAGLLMQEVGYGVAHPDVVGTGFTSLEIQRFRLERIYRNLLQRNLRKLVRSKSERILRTARAVFGRRASAP